MRLRMLPATNQRLVHTLAREAAVAFWFNPEQPLSFLAEAGLRPQQFWCAKEGLWRATFGLAVRPAQQEMQPRPSCAPLPIPAMTKRSYKADLT